MRAYLLEMPTKIEHEREKYPGFSLFLIPQCSTIASPWPNLARASSLGSEWNRKRPGMDQSDESAIRQVIDTY